MFFKSCQRNLMDDEKNFDSKLDTKIIYQRLCECRDLEIEHYWHRMVFMTAFMLVTYAGYGGFVKEYLFLDGEKLSGQYFNLISIGLVFIGIVVSSLWIMMSKGSKAWYEQYEKVIEVFLEYEKENDNKYFLSGQYNKISKCGIETNDALWSTKAGSFSVSRVGIFIGQFSLFMWIVLLGIHIYLYIKSATNIQIWQMHPETIIILLGFGFILFWLVTLEQLKSHFFKK